MEWIGYIIGATQSPEVSNAVAWLNALKSAYKKKALRDELINWLLIKDYMESGAFTNEGTKQNNPGNIMWNKHDKYGKKGTYNKINHTYYSSYPTIDDYVNKMIQVIKQSPGRPYDATSGEDFVKRLAANTYFGKITAKNTIENYIAAMKGAAQRINLLSDLQADTNQQIVTPSSDSTSFIDKIKDFVTDHPIASGAIGIGLIVLIVKRK